MLTVELATTPGDRDDSHRLLCQKGAMNEIKERPAAEAHVTNRLNATNHTKLSFTVKSKWPSLTRRRLSSPRRRVIRAER
jgi:hypothetical protein